MDTFGVVGGILKGYLRRIWRVCYFRTPFVDSSRALGETEQTSENGNFISKQKSVTLRTRNETFTGVRLFVES